MAEAIAALGAFSSALQIVECLTKVISRTHKLLSSAHGELSEHGRLKSLANEYSNLGASSSGISFVGAHAEDNRSSPLLIGIQEVTRNHRSVNNLLRPLRAAERYSYQEEAIVRLGQECKTESSKLLNELGALDVKSDTKGLKRISEATKAALKSVYKRKEIERLRKRLEELNGQLATAILQSLYEKQYWHRVYLDDAADDDVERVASILQQKCLEDTVIPSLRFPGMDSRSDSVEHAYPTTYTWALDADSQLSFWLRDQSGIFWITGKAGSGKSTLTKFVARHPQTRNLLASWSGSSQLVIANFFFWYAGTTLQKSIPGLLRTILYQILRKNPSLIRAVFPKAFGTITADGPPVTEWMHGELVEAVTRLADLGDKARSHKKFCLFIDGLDEYHGDHLELVALLKCLTRNRSIKICASSRPWNAFRNTLGTECPQLLLEHLTRPDIYHYVDERIFTALARCTYLRRGQDQSEPQTLIREIVDKAEGVFLWVRLVVESIIRGLSEGDSISMLRHRVQSYPADLDDFFADILGRVDSVYKQQTHQALYLACMYVNSSSDFLALSTFHDNWLIAQHPNGVYDSDFAFSLKCQTVSYEEAKSMVLQTRDILCATCKDLLHIPALSRGNDGHEDHRFDKPLHIQVHFLHRTVFDFLQTDKMQSLLVSQIPEHFKDFKILHHFNLARLKVRLPSLEENELEGLFGDFEWLSIKRSHDNLNERYINEFAAIIVHFFGMAGLYQHFEEQPRLLSCFTAFPASNIGLRYIQTLSAKTYETAFSDDARDCFLLAALGEDPRNRFGLHKVDLEVVKELAKAGLHREWRTKWRPEHWTESLFRSDCSMNGWRLFLHKWALTVQSGETINNNVRRKFWEIAKIFLRTGEFFLDDSMVLNQHTSIPQCECPYEISTPGALETVYCFIAIQVPKAWLSELIEDGIDYLADYQRPRQSNESEGKLVNRRRSDARRTTMQRGPIRIQKRRPHRSPLNIQTTQRYSSATPRQFPIVRAYRPDYPQFYNVRRASYR